MIAPLLAVWLTAAVTELLAGFVLVLVGLTVTITGLVVEVFLD